ncbi:uncharacterized protein LOC132736472 [Ruditapes philippinarum]|uniref:uncharacterized protein LOC132736472 n=1 Tax=Ruditapes philippinarum TaxID=129788 RepID=UPI00295AB6EF|nr:uncharacterized protein LOC132736472 [Ruditapes philippinarum]
MHCIFNLIFFNMFEKIEISGLLFKHIIFALYILRAKCVSDNFDFRAFPADLRMVQGVPFPLKVGVSQCCLVCASDDTCTSVNFNKVSQVCEINTLKMKSREYHMQSETGWKLYEKLPCGLGYMTGERCRHIQNQFQYYVPLTHQNASDFCNLLGENILTLENEQDKLDLQSDAGLAEMDTDAFIWLRDRIGTSCAFFRREFADEKMRNCDLNANIVCE